MASDWEISRATGKCAVTGRELAEGEFYYAALFENPQGFERRDYSLEGWSGPPEGSFCHFKTRVPVRGKKPTIIAVDSAMLAALFTRLEEDSSEMRQKFRFVLALLLMRKRLLRFERSVTEDDREFWYMRLLADQSTHRILNPQLSSTEIDHLSSQLTAILSGDASAITALENGDAASLPADQPESSLQNGEVTGEANQPGDALGVGPVSSRSFEPPVGSESAIPASQAPDAENPDVGTVSKENPSATD